MTNDATSLAQGRDVRDQAVERLSLKAPLKLDDPRMQLEPTPAGSRSEGPSAWAARTARWALAASSRSVALRPAGSWRSSGSPRLQVRAERPPVSVSRVWKSLCAPRSFRFNFPVDVGSRSLLVIRPASSILDPRS